MDWFLALVCYWRHGTHWDALGHFVDGRTLYHCWACRKFRIAKRTP